MNLILFIFGVVVGCLAEVTASIVYDRHQRKNSINPETLAESIDIAEKLCVTEVFISVQEERAIRKLIDVARERLSQEDDLR